MLTSFYLNAVEARESLLELNLKDVALDGEVKVKEIGRKLNGYSVRKSAYSFISLNLCYIKSRIKTILCFFQGADITSVCR